MSPEYASSSGEAGEVALACTLAATSYLEHPGDDERAARSIAARLGWSSERARWCIAVNRERVDQLVEEMRAHG